MPPKGSPERRERPCEAPPRTFEALTVGVGLSLGELCVNSVRVKQSVVGQTVADNFERLQNKVVPVNLHAICNLGTDAVKTEAKELLVVGNGVTLIAAGPPKTRVRAVISGETENLCLAVIHSADVTGIKAVAKLLETGIMLVCAIAEDVFVFKSVAPDLQTV